MADACTADTKDHKLPSYTGRRIGQSSSKHLKAMSTSGTTNATQSESGTRTSHTESALCHRPVTWKGRSTWQYKQRCALSQSQRLEQSSREVARQTGSKNYRQCGHLQTDQRQRRCKVYVLAHPSGLLWRDQRRMVQRMSWSKLQNKMPRIRPVHIHAEIRRASRQWKEHYTMRNAKWGLENDEELWLSSPKERAKFTGTKLERKELGKKERGVKELGMKELSKSDDSWELYDPFQVDHRKKGASPNHRANLTALRYLQWFAGTFAEYTSAKSRTPPKRSCFPKQTTKNNGVDSVQSKNNHKRAQNRRRWRFF